LEIIGRFKLTGPLLHEQQARVRIGEIEFPTRRKNRRNDVCPHRQIRGMTKEFSRTVVRAVGLLDVFRVYHASPMVCA
jgi:hypothetical protein